MVVNNTNFLFDIDGTLTPSRSKIDSNFKEFFLKWMQKKCVYLVTGSDKEKTIEQVGLEIWKKVKRSYQSCGNAVYENGELIRKLDFLINPKLETFLNDLLKNSYWKEKYKLHIDQRIGLLISQLSEENAQKKKEKDIMNGIKKLKNEKLCVNKLKKNFLY